MKKMKRKFKISSKVQTSSGLTFTQTFKYGNNYIQKDIIIILYGTK